MSSTDRNNKHQSYYILLVETILISNWKSRIRVFITWLGNIFLTIMITAWVFFKHKTFYVFLFT